MKLAGAEGASGVAEMILQRGDSDIAFIPRLMGESLHLLTSHFVSFIEDALQAEGVSYGDHPLLRPLVEMHSRELVDYVVNGVGLKHQIGLQAFERMTGDPARLFRVDLWDSFTKLIEEAEQAFLQRGGGLRALLAEITKLRTEVQSGSLQQ